MHIPAAPSTLTFLSAIGELLKLLAWPSKVVAALRPLRRNSAMLQLD